MRSRSMNLIGCSSSMLLRRKVHLDPNLIGCFRMLLPLCATFHPLSIEKGIKLKRSVPKKMGLKIQCRKSAVWQNKFEYSYRRKTRVFQQFVYRCARNTPWYLHTVSSISLKISYVLQESHDSDLYMFLI